MTNPRPPDLLSPATVQSIDRLWIIGLARARSAQSAPVHAGPDTKTWVETVMAAVIPINRKRQPTYLAYPWPTALSEGAALVLSRMGLHQCAELQCWTNAPEHWTLDQVRVLLSRTSESQD